MLKKIIAWGFVFCVLPALAMAAQEESHFTWTIDELSSVVSLKEREDGLPVYEPKAPVEGAALYVHDLQTRNGNPVYSLNMRSYIMDLMEGSLLFTDDPDQASIMLFYEEWNDFAANYTTSTGLVHAYSSTARLRMISLTDDNAQPVQASHTKSPGDVITVTGSSWYAQMPTLYQTDQMDLIITALLAKYPSDQVVKIGTDTIRRDAREVILSAKGISDISSVSSFKLLTELTLFDNEITDISPLSSLGELKVLKLGGNNIVDISPLAGLVNLQDLNLAYNKITDVSTLSDLELLVSINLNVNHVVDISPLAVLNDLRYFSLTHNGITDISPLAGLEQLIELRLGSNQIVDISPLSKLGSLTYLDLAHNEMTDISSLSSLERLEYLYISRNRITDYSPLYEMKRLKRLEIDSESINSEALQILKEKLPKCQIIER